MDKHSVRVHFSDGDSLVTSIHGTRVSVAQYYVGRTFNLGDGCGGDRMLRCVSIEFLGAETISKNLSK